MKDRTQLSISGYTFCLLLSLVFIVLQLTGYINWSWWLVLMPIYLPPLVFALAYIIIVSFVLVFVIIGGIGIAIIDELDKKKKKKS